jgi:glycosyltransferase involved in cell wall biosynthesis
MSKLSVIIPFVNEYPQNYFTLQSLFCQLENSKIDWEIIAVDNYCDEVLTQYQESKIICPKCNLEFRPHRIKDAGGEKIKGVFPKLPNCKFIEYNKKLSHWNAKNEAMRIATGDVFFFMDSHCILSTNAVESMFSYYVDNRGSLNGSLHLPICYMLEHSKHALGYKLITEWEKGVVHYSFTRYKGGIYKAPCMSTCGMMIGKDIILDTMGGWPSELGIYGGGENYFNFTLAVLGYDINMFNDGYIWHFAEKRGYNWNYTDYHRNRAIATYFYGDQHLLIRYLEGLKGNQQVWDTVFCEIQSRCGAHKNTIESSKKITIEEWAEKWEKNLTTD